MSIIVPISPFKKGTLQVHQIIPLLQRGAPLNMFFYMNDDTEEVGCWNSYEEIPDGGYQVEEQTGHDVWCLSGPIGGRIFVFSPGAKNKMCKRVGPQTLQNSASP